MNRLTPLLCTILLLSACTPVAPGGDANSSSSAFVASSVESSVQADADMVVDSPVADAVVHSPLEITGKARGTWYSEAVFPVRLLDDKGDEIVVSHADAQGDWMTENFVPFTASLTFTTTAKTGTLMLQKDNPSGEQVNDKSVSIPVQF